jgi:hypothetical protein
MISDILAPWRRFWALPWPWKGPILGGVGVTVLIIGVVIGSAGGNDGAGNAAGVKFTQASPTVTASGSPGATDSPSASPSGDEGTPTPQATEPGEPVSTPPEGVVTPPPEPAESLGPAVPLLAPASPPPPPPGLSQEDLATLAQFDYCATAWWKGAGIELQLGLISRIQTDATQIQQQLQQQLQGIKGYLEQNCVGIGARAGAIPGIGAVRCDNVRTSTNTLKLWGSMAQYLKSGTYSLDFATKELDAFAAAAGC